MGGDDHLHAPDPAYFGEVPSERLLPDHMEGDLGLVDDNQRSGARMEQQDVEHHQDLLLSGGKLLDLQRGAVVHGYADPPRVGDGHGLVDEDVVHDVLVDYRGLGEEVVPAYVGVYRTCELLVPVTVLGDLIAGGRELLPCGYVRFEPSVPDEVQLRLEVLAPELQLAVRHVLRGIVVRMLQLAVLLGVAHGLGQLLGEDLQRGRNVAVALAHGVPLGRQVHGITQLQHAVGTDVRGHLAPPHVHEEVAGRILDDQVRAVLEGDVEPLERGVLQVFHVAAEGGVEHPHERRLPHSVGGMDECQRYAQIQAVVVLVEQACDADGLDEHDVFRMASNGYIE